ncbi:MAG: DUF2807 domain-containing protein [Flavobacteriaceae bacterium]|nr:DUF2807 domain-containing protein [Flavobacteriaceae bacterium]
MTTLTKFIAAAILSLFLLSCSFNSDFSFGVRGNGNVKTEERSISGYFDSIEISRGLDVYLTQSDHESLKVQADENLHDIITTKVENNTLKIFADKNIINASAQKVMLSFKNIEKISTHSGSDVYTTNKILGDAMEINASSGSDIELEVQADIIECKSTSGSIIRISGAAVKFYANASSGSTIKAKNLKVEFSEAKASSGAEITVNPAYELIAKASSGGNINYYGSPEKITKSAGVSGNIRKQ